MGDEEENGLDDVETLERLDAEQQLERERDARRRAEDQLEAERSARTRSDAHVRALLNTRTFRYARPLRALFALLSDGRAAAAQTVEIASSEGVAPTRAEPETPLGRGGSPEFVPPGHFYSAIPDLEDIEARRSEIFDRDPSSIPGVRLRVDEQLRLLEELVPFLEDVPFEDAALPSFRYHYANGMFDRSDGLFMHLMLRHLRPTRIVEIGSGYSSACMLDTIERFGTGTHCTFVDPNAQILRSVLRADDDEAVDIIELPVQRAPLELYSRLGPDDLLFIDSTHVVKVGSDVNHLFFDVLPTLRPGVVVHVHDVFPLFEYPWKWVLERRAWSESYLLRAFLQFNDEFEILLWPPLLARLQPQAYARFHPPTGNTGGSLYMRRRSAPSTT